MFTSKTWKQNPGQVWSKLPRLRCAQNSHRNWTWINVHMAQNCSVPFMADMRQPTLTPSDHFIGCAHSVLTVDARCWLQVTKGGSALGPQLPTAGSCSQASALDLCWFYWYWMNIEWASKIKSLFRSSLKYWPWKKFPTANNLFHHCVKDCGFLLPLEGSLGKNKPLGSCWRILELWLCWQAGRFPTPPTGNPPSLGVLYKGLPQLK